MKISVIIPAYQAAPYIGRCLAAVRAQTLVDLEIIAVDDGSTDGTGAALLAIAAEEPRLQVIYQENQGVSAARNAGLARARGDYIAFADADDTLPPEALATLLAAARRGAPADIVSGEIELIAAEGQTERLTGPAREPREAIIASLVRSDGRYNSPCGRLYRRAFLAEHGIVMPVGVPVGEDVLFNLAAFLAAERWQHVPQVVYTYQRQPAGAMARSQAGALAAHEPMLAALEALLRQAHLKPRYWRDFLELQAGLAFRDGSTTLTAAAARRVNRGVRPWQLPKKQAALWLLLALGQRGTVCARVQQGMALPLS